jgi:hypothetical protein
MLIYFGIIMTDLELTSLIIPFYIALYWVCVVNVRMRKIHQHIYDIHRIFNTYRANLLNDQHANLLKLYREELPQLLENYRKNPNFILKDIMDTKLNNLESQTDVVNQIIDETYVLEDTLPRQRMVWLSPFIRNVDWFFSEKLRNKLNNMELFNNQPHSDVEFVKKDMFMFDYYC